MNWDKATDFELARKGVQIMGWSRGDFVKGDTGHPHLYTSSGFPAFFDLASWFVLLRSAKSEQENWDPANLASQALELAEKVRRMAMGIRITIYRAAVPSDTWYVAIHDAFEFDEDERPDLTQDANQPTFSRALTVAAIKFWEANQ